MAENEKAHKSEHLKNPQPKQDHLWQDDVKSLAKTFYLIDGDVNELTKKLRILKVLYSRIMQTQKQVMRQ